MKRMVTLPADMTDDDAKARFKNGSWKCGLKKKIMLQEIAYRNKT